MGKNQQHKQAQRSRHGDEEGGGGGTGDGEFGTDVSYHTAEWHAARIAALQVERMPYDEWKKKQKEEAAARQVLLPGAGCHSAYVLAAQHAACTPWVFTRI